jgi:hypothetical protein
LIGVNSVYTHNSVVSEMAIFRQVTTNKQQNSCLPVFNRA